MKTIVVGLNRNSYVDRFHPSERKTTIITPHQKYLNNLNK